jgi:hypothetical protein
MSYKEAKMAKTAYQAHLLSLPNVVGLGVGYKSSKNRVSDELSVVVMVRHKISLLNLSPEEIIPEEVGNVRTDVVEVGEIRPLATRTDRIRPAPGGVSIGHYKVTAGTLGVMVRDRKSGTRMILSNNHVLANENEAELGDPILQPGAADGGTQEKDVIALLERFETIHFNEEPAACSVASAYALVGNTIARMLGSHHRVKVFQSNPLASNTIDAALARPILDSDLLDEILEIGEINGVDDASLGMSVMKSGRTTGLTNGTVTIIDATVSVNYGSDRSATFDHQIVSSPMSQGGDSGSLLVTSTTKHAVGLLFAGSNQATLFNPVKSVLNILDVNLASAAEAKALPNRRDMIEKAQAVKSIYQEMLMSLPNVVGVGIGPRFKDGKRTDQIGVVVMVQQKLPASALSPQDMIPAVLEGIPVDVQEVGTFEAQ